MGTGKNNASGLSQTVSHSQNVSCHSSREAAISPRIARPTRLMGTGKNNASGHSQTVSYSQYVSCHSSREAAISPRIARPTRLMGTGKNNASGHSQTVSCHSSRETAISPRIARHIPLTNMGYVTRPETYIIAAARESHRSRRQETGMTATSQEVIDGIKEFDSATIFNAVIESMGGSQGGTELEGQGGVPIIYTDPSLNCYLPDLGTAVGYAVTCEVTALDPDSRKIDWHDYYDALERYAVTRHWRNQGHRLKGRTRRRAGRRHGLHPQNGRCHGHRRRRLNSGSGRHRGSGLARLGQGTRPRTRRLQPDSCRHSRRRRRSAHPPQ